VYSLKSRHCERVLDTVNVRRNKLPSGTKDVNDARDVTSTDGAFRESFAAVRTGHHVATLQQDTVNDGVHAHLAQVVVFDCVRIGISCNQHTPQE